MARLVAAFGSSHSIMLVATREDWISAFRESDRRMPLFDRTGVARSYEELLQAAPGEAGAGVTPEKMAACHARSGAAVAELKRQIDATPLDALIVVGDDQHELFQDAMMPSLAIYYGATIRNAARREVPDGDWYRRAQILRLEPESDAHYKVHADLALHLIAGLARQEFDVCAVKEIGAHQYEGHAYSYIHRTYLDGRVLPIVPVMLNTYYPPNQMTPARCVRFGAALKNLIAAFPEPLRVGLLASGGLSHFVVDEALDRGVIAALKAKDFAHLAGIDPKHLQAGSSEIRSWIVVGAAAADLDLVWVDYIPAYRTPALTGTGLGFARWS
jgi:Catalytic LigB subunit of aromatic ring-opening dioxygenase